MPLPTRAPDLASAAIVFTGSFNPSIFQPAWFSRQNLISNDEADAADVKILHAQVSHFESESFVVQVTAERFLAATKPTAHYAVLRDLVLGTFFILEHTPVTGMGLNRMIHFSMPSVDDWHAVGDKLAPKDGWSGILGGRPGLLTLEVQGARPDRADVVVRAKVQPSTRIQPGVYFETNEHYPALGAEPLKHLLETLRDRWDESQAYADQLANHILNWAHANGIVSGGS
jgi:hypothetical protein